MKFNRWQILVRLTADGAAIVLPVPMPQVLEVA